MRNKDYVELFLPVPLLKQVSLGFGGQGFELLVVGGQGFELLGAGGWELGVGTVWSCSRLSLCFSMS